MGAGGLSCGRSGVTGSRGAQAQVLVGLLGSRRTLLPGVNTCVVENPQNGEPKVGPSPRQPGPWAIPSRKERGGASWNVPPASPITAAQGPTPTPEAESEPWDGWGGGRSTQKEVILQAQGLGARSA